MFQRVRGVSFLHGCEAMPKLVQSDCVGSIVDNGRDPNPPSAKGSRPAVKAILDLDLVVFADLP